MRGKSIMMLGCATVLLALAACAPPEPPPPYTPYDGYYSGNATLIRTAGGRSCAPSLGTQALAVVSSYVNAGDYQGYISQDGLLALTSNGTGMTGSFAHSQFTGNVNEAGRCLYRLDMTRLWLNG